MSTALPSDHPVQLNEQDRSMLRKLRHHSAHRRRTAQAAPPALPELGSRIADTVAAVVGSWRFILLQSALLAVWVIANAAFGGTAWDPYPFILLNLLLSFQAAYTAPIIMMSQNRQAEIDRQRAESDYSINIKAELEIELLHQKIDLLREQELLALTRAIEALAQRIDGKPA